MILSSLLLSIAANFDKVAILCHKEGCDGMLDRWPLDFQSRVHVFDGAQIDPMFTDQVDNVRKTNKVHEFLVTMSHVHVANTLFTNFTDDETSSYLFLEEDYEVVQPKEDSGMSLNNSASNIARFVENDESWQFLRLGYNPANWQTRTEALRCKSSCVCQTVFDGICSITPGKFGNKALCWVGSTVGYAVHRRAWPALQKLGNCSMVADIKNFKLSIDNWLPGFSRDYRYWSPVHYLIPGVLYQPVPSRYLTKSRSREAMEGFASNCVTPFGQSFPSNTSTGQLAAKTLSPKKRIKKRDKKKDRRRHIISQSL